MFSEYGLRSAGLPYTAFSNYAPMGRSAAIAAMKVKSDLATGIAKEGARFVGVNINTISTSANKHRKEVIWRTHLWV